MLDEEREWIRHCKSWRHQYLLKLKVREEEMSAFQDTQCQPFPARIWLEQSFDARIATRGMRGAQQFAGI